MLQAFTCFDFNMAFIYLVVTQVAVVAALLRVFSTI